MSRIGTLLPFKVGELTVFLIPIGWKILFQPFFVA
jgi:hypothetical protein